MNIVVDTNIVFSGILSPQGTISDLLLNSQNILHFFAPTVLLDELDVHHQKILTLSGYSENELAFITRTIIKKIDLIDLATIQKVSWEKALELTSNVDEFDAPFIALSLELNAPLWTGDKKLTNGLKQQGIEWILDTEAIKMLRNEE